MAMVPAQTEEEALACVRQTPLPVLEKAYTRSDRVAMTAVATVAAVPTAFPPTAASVANAAAPEGTGLASAGFLGDRTSVALASSQPQIQDQVELQAFGADASSINHADNGAIMEIGNCNEDNDMMMEMTL